MAAVTRVIDALTNVAKWITMTVIAIMILVITTAVLFRQFGRPIVGTEEIVSMLQVALIMFGVALAQSNDKHISVGIIVDHLPKRIQYIIDYFCYVVTSVMCFVFSKIFFDLAIESHEIGEYSLLLRFPHYILYIVFTIGFFLWGLEALNRILKLTLHLRSTKPNSDTEERS